MALTQYTADTDIIETLGTNPEDRPTLTDNTFKAKFDENSANIKTFLNAMIAELASTANGKGASQIGIEDSAGRYTATQIEAALAEIAGSGRTTETVKGLADLISTNDGKLTTHKVEVTSYVAVASRALSAADGAQTVALAASRTPRKISILSAIPGTAVSCTGTVASNGQFCISQSYDGTMVYSVPAIYISTSAGNSLIGTVAIQSGQITITWVKTGSPTGTLNIIVTADYHD